MSCSESALEEQKKATETLKLTIATMFEVQSYCQHILELPFMVRKGHESKHQGQCTTMSLHLCIKDTTLGVDNNDRCNKQIAKF
jgi:hypothetical protein